MKMTLIRNDYRSIMPGWTPDASMILSLLLEVVVGTKEEIAMRQEYCRMFDSLLSLRTNNVYYTGSKAEGLELPGSDMDYMFDINNMHRVRVIQSLNENIDVGLDSIFLMCTENTPPGFVLLKHVHQTIFQTFLYQSSRNINGQWYLSSDVFIQKSELHTRQDQMYLGINSFIQRQGPSLEYWTHFSDRSESGSDLVLSVHCAFWPNEALEWAQRTRYYEWPSSQKISSIIDFGFHLVPVGSSQSETNFLEWRISFSVAERTLVWSFNHIQMQCYAVMKIVLKEFIKVRCSPQNQVLCSYFIKTFIFWKYETTELNFWRADNLRECIKRLLVEFSQCLRQGVLRHYFIPRFNLFSVKLTRAAQTELLQLFDIINQSDISVLKECQTLREIWSEFLQVRQGRINVLPNLKTRNLLRIDECAIKIFIQMRAKDIIPLCRIFSLSNAICQNIARRFCKTPLKSLVLRKCHLENQLHSVKHTCVTDNKDVYQLCRTANMDTYSFDISTCKLWCAILLYKKGSILFALDYVNKVLSSIPPFVMYMEYIDNFNNCTTKEEIQLYVSMFLDSGITIIQRARTAWMFDLCITQDMTNLVPLAFNIELFFHANNGTLVNLSPFTCAYYLQFMCYHDMHQYNNRDNALRELMDIVNDVEQKRNGKPYISLNITGHCLLLAGRRDQARNMFLRSYVFTQETPMHEQNSAAWYLQNCF